jgi:ribosomal protein S18 acetylase RimI-like enzyme
MQISRAKIEDMREILDLQKSAYLSEAKIYNNYNIPPLIQTLEEITNDFQNQIYLKVVINKKIVGSVRAYIKNGTCFIGRLIVLPKFQNQGIDKALMREIETLFKDAERYELFTGHISHKNLLFYQKLGYEPFKTEKIDNNLTFNYLQKSSNLR